MNPLNEYTVGIYPKREDGGNDYAQSPTERKCADMAAALHLLEINPNSHVDAVMAYDDAVKFIKASRSRDLYISATMFAPSMDPVKRREERGHNVSGFVPLTKPAILKVLESMYSKTRRLDCMVIVYLTGQCLFIGGTAAYERAP
jgi:hypothetical protein